MKKTKLKGKTPASHAPVSARRLHKDKHDRGKSVNADADDRKHGRSLREVHNKHSDDKVSDKKNSKTHKTSNSRKLAKVSKFAIKEDKENKNFENKNNLGGEAKRQHKDPLVAKAADDGHKHKKLIADSISVKVESSDSPAGKPSDAKATKRVSLKKKSDVASKASASKTSETK